jgi:hypothetical protein
MNRSVVPDLRLKSNVVPVGHFCASGQGMPVVEQRAVAEAVLTPINAVEAATATAAKPSIFKHLMTPP